MSYKLKDNWRDKLTDEERKLCTVIEAMPLAYIYSSCTYGGETSFKPDVYRWYTKRNLDEAVEEYKKHIRNHSDWTNEITKWNYKYLSPWDLTIEPDSGKHVETLAPSREAILEYSETIGCPCGECCQIVIHQYPSAFECSRHKYDGKEDPYIKEPPWKGVAMHLAGHADYMKKQNEKYKYSPYRIERIEDTINLLKKYGPDIFDLSDHYLKKVWKCPHH